MGCFLTQILAATPQASDHLAAWMAPARQRALVCDPVNVPRAMLALPAKCRQYLQAASALTAVRKAHAWPAQTRRAAAMRHACVILGT